MQVFTKDGTIELEASVSKKPSTSPLLVSEKYLLCPAAVEMGGLIGWVTSSFTRKLL